MSNSFPFFVPKLPYVEVYEHMSYVMEGFDGTEQRARIRRKPRRSYELNYAEEGGREGAALLAWLTNAIGKLTWLPMCCIIGIEKIGLRF